MFAALMALLALVVLADSVWVRTLAALLGLALGAAAWLRQRQGWVAAQAQERSAERLACMLRAQAPLPVLLDAATDALRLASGADHVLIYRRAPGAAAYTLAHQSGSPACWPPSLPAADAEQSAQVNAIFAAAGWPQAVVCERISPELLMIAVGLRAYDAEAAVPLLHMLKPALNPRAHEAPIDAHVVLGLIAQVLQPQPDLRGMAAPALEAALAVSAADTALLMIRDKTTGAITCCEQTKTAGFTMREGVAAGLLESLLLGMTEAEVLSDAAVLPPGMRAAAVAPLRSGGVLAVFSRAAVSDQVPGMLAALAECVSTAMRARSMLADLSEMGGMLRMLHAATAQMAGVMDAQAISAILLRFACDQLRVDIGALYSTRSENEPLTLRHALGGSPADGALMAEAARRASSDNHLATTLLPDGRHLLTAPMGSVHGLRHVLCVICALDRQPDECDRQSLMLLTQQTAAFLDTILYYEQARNSANRIRALLNSARDGIILLDKEGRLLECNPAAERLLGLERDEVLQQHLVTVLMHMMEGDAPTGLGYSRAELTMLARQLRLEPQRITRREFRRQGLTQTVYVEEIGGPVRSDTGEITGRLMIFRDITEHHLAAQYRDEITRMMVHDLRGPLWAVQTGIQIAQSELAVSEQSTIVRITLDVALQSTRDLMRIVDSLLDIARLERREMPLKPVRTSPARLIRSAQSTLEAPLAAAGITLIDECPGDLPDLIVDEDVMRRVLVNLLDNALRYTPQGGRILISGSASSTELRLTIADSGPGIPVADRERVFERFQQVKHNIPQRGSKGSGLGLTFCKLAVEAHGGRVWVESSTPLGGAAFNLTLPLAAALETREIDQASD